MSLTSKSVDIGYVRMLYEPGADEPAVTGSKAAALAAARAHGLPVIPGFALTTRAHADFLAAGRSFSGGLAATLERAWADFTHDGRDAVVVRSSSTVEDVSASSMAGRFRSILDVRGRDGFFDAVAEVWASADAVAEDGVPQPMGVLVQRFLTPSRSGVMFGVDPVTGDRSTIVVEAVSGGPDQLVSGRVAAQHLVLGRRGRLLRVDNQPVGPRHPFPPRSLLLSAADLVRLATLARTTERVFGAPQDVEWAVDDGDLYLLQSRPVTATAAAAPARGPVMGPGPLAETFPDPLSVLERDLWVRPLREGVVDAMTETAAVPPRRIAASSVVTTVHGRVAADLELFGYVPSRNRLGRLNPFGAVRRMRAAWRIGMLRAGLAARTAEQVADVDRWLADVDPLTMSDEDLLTVLDQAVAVLRSLHHHEVLAGTLLPPAPATAAALALGVLQGADPGQDEVTLVRRHPVLLSLSPPSLSAPATLPPRVPTPVPPDVSAMGEARTGPLGEREQLRLRARWVQEMTGYAVRVLGRRLAERGVVEHSGHVNLLRLEELRPALVEGVLPDQLQQRLADELAAAFSAPLPAKFRLTEEGDAVPAERPGARPGFGVPAGGGRGLGPVCHGSPRRPPEPGDVLVVRTLDPGLAGWLPGLAGLVSETGASLSHLAILAREYGVPTVVGVYDALTRFPTGTRVLVDGATGEVRAASEEETT